MLHRRPLGQKGTNWELGQFNTDSCMTEVRAATVGGKTVLQGKDPARK